MDSILEHPGLTYHIQGNVTLLQYYWSKVIVDELWPTSFDIYILRALQYF